MGGWERGHRCQAQSRAGRELLWQSPQPPARPSPLQALGGEMSSGGSGSGSCHCCPWERGRGRDAPLFSPGAAEPRACEAAPWGGHIPGWLCGVKPWGTERGQGTARTTGLALPHLVHQEGPCWGQGVTAEPLPQGAGAGRQLPSVGRDKGTLWPWLGVWPAWVLWQSSRAPRAGHLPTSWQPRRAPFAAATLLTRLHLLPGRKLISSGNPMTPGAGAFRKVCADSSMVEGIWSLQRHKLGDPRVPSSLDFVCLVYCVALGINR